MNQSFKKYETKPNLSLATFYIEVNGENKYSILTSYLEARYVAGPLPIDLPIRIISFKLNFTFKMKNFRIDSASYKIFFSLGVSYVYTPYDGYSTKAA